MDHHFQFSILKNTYYECRNIVEDKAKVDRAVAGQFLSTLC